MKNRLLTFAVAMLFPFTAFAQFSDDFNRIGPDLGVDWINNNSNFSIVNNQLVENSGLTNATSQLVWAGSQTTDVNQFGKLQIVTSNTHSWGFIFRAAGTPGVHYEVHPTSTNEWRWESQNVTLTRLSTCLADTPLADGNWIGATVEGVGPNTIVSIWRWNTDPDAGAAVNVSANWGTPTCTMTASAGTFVDTGLNVGIRSYTGNATTNAVADNWFSGDLATVISVPDPECVNPIQAPCPYDGSKPNFRLCSSAALEGGAVATNLKYCEIKVNNTSLVQIPTTKPSQLLEYPMPSGTGDVALEVTCCREVNATIMCSAPNSCTTLRYPAACGNDILEGTEECDGLIDVACPGACQADCTCGIQAPILLP